MTAAERPLRAFQLIETVTRLLADALQDSAEFKYRIQYPPLVAAGCDIHIIVGPATDPAWKPVPPQDGILRDVPWDDLPEEAVELVRAKLAERERKRAGVTLDALEAAG